MPEIKKSQFAIYVEGYIDGYAGVTARTPGNDTYIQGHNAGNEDDMLGLDCKYNVEGMPITTTQCMK